MKASEFPLPPKNPTLLAKQPVSEAKQPVHTKSRHTPKHTKHVAPFGVDDADGHVMRRIRVAHPHLITKLDNWD